MLTTPLRYLKGTLSTFPDASFQIHCKFAMANPLFSSVPHFSHTHTPHTQRALCWGRISNGFEVKRLEANAIN